MSLFYATLITGLCLIFSGGALIFTKGESTKIFNRLSAFKASHFLHDGHSHGLVFL